MKLSQQTRVEHDWPECPQCHSDNTEVVPLTGEWTCQNCGRQWTSDETPVDTGDADRIPEDIRAMVEAIAEATDE